MITPIDLVKSPYSKYSINPPKYDHDYETLKEIYKEKNVSIGRIQHYIYHIFGRYSATNVKIVKQITKTKYLIEYPAPVAMRKTIVDLSSGFPYLMFKDHSDARAVRQFSLLLTSDIIAPPMEKYLMDCLKNLWGDQSDAIRHYVQSVGVAITAMCIREILYMINARIKGIEVQKIQLPESVLNFDIWTDAIENDYSDEMVNQ